MARRKQAGPRSKSGRKSRAFQGPARDNGTAEVQAKRAAMVGDADPALAASAPGILFARGILDQEQYTAALRYRQLRCALYGPPWPGNATAAGEAAAGTIARMQREFDRLIREMTADQRHTVAELAVFDVIPTWFFVARLGLHPLPEDETQRIELLAGLDAMLGRRRAAAA